MVDVSKHDPFNAPIPGESLTKSMGSAPWEQSPQFADKDDAAEYIFTKLTSPSQMNKVVSLIEVGVPVETVAKGMLLSGFQEGKWTPDVALLLGRVTMSMIISIAKKAGVKDADIKYGNPKKIQKEMDFFKKLDESTGGKLKEKRASRASIPAMVEESIESAEPISLMEKL